MMGKTKGDIMPRDTLAPIEIIDTRSLADEAALIRDLVAEAGLDAAILVKVLAPMEMMS